MNTIIKTHELTKTYQGKRAVDTLSLSVKKGEIFGFLGHNGAGKTTTISMLITLLNPSSGQAWINGYHITGQSMEVRRSIGYLPEQVALYNELSVSENLQFFASLSGAGQPKKQTEKVLEKLHISSWKDRKVSHLSKGMRQRVGLAQAIIHEPAILFLDEPSSGLDPQGTLELRELLRQLNREDGTTIFMNTHMLTEVSHLCTSIGILQNGKLIIQGRLEKVLSQFPGEANLEDIYLKAMEKGDK